MVVSHGRGRTRAPLSSVDSNLVRTDSVGTPLTSREVDNEVCKSGGVISMNKKRRPKTSRKNEIHTPLVFNDSTTSRLNGAVNPTRNQPLHSSSSATKEPLSSHKSGGETVQPSAGASVEAETAIASVGNNQQHIVLNFGCSNVVGKTRSLPFRFVGTASTTAIDTQFPIELEHIPVTRGFGVILEGHDIMEHGCEVCNSKTARDVDARTIFHLKQEQYKIIHVHWTPTQEGEVREEICLKSPWGRFQVSLLGIARDTVQTPTLAKTKIQPKKYLTTFHARDNIAYDSQCWEDRQCATFTTWLNTVFHPESNCNRIDDDQIILEWKAAKQLFDSPKMRAIRCSVEREVKYGRLSITPRSDDGHLAVTPGTDRNILDEVHVREQLIKLLLSYSPRWLEMGLGTVLAMNDSEIMKKQTNKQANSYMSKRSLHKLILERLLTEPSQPRKYTSGGCKTLSWKFECKMRIANYQYALSQIMILIYFLDSAKRNRVLTEDPCLFEKSSRMKSSEEMLISLCQDCFSMRGSTIKHLDYEGISVCHVQYPLDEYDFHVKNLAADLKDGVCLAKLIETVTNTPNILLLLRLPATTREKKIYNVDIVLATLRQLGVPNISDITTAHIVAAHQPRILQLLWSVIIFFDLPQFRSETLQYIASRRIQSYMRRFLKRRSFQITRHGVISFQSAYRGFVARTTAQKMINASKMIQKTLRGYHAKLAYTFNLKSIIAIQRFCRHCIARYQLNMTTRSFHSAAIRIQKTWRGRRCMIDFGRDLMGIITMQSICRCFIARNRVHRAIRKINAAVNIQRIWRGYQHKMNVKSICGDVAAFNRSMRKSNSTETPSIRIQRVWRGYNAKLLYGFKLLDIITVQSTCRRFIAQKAMSRKNACALKIQSLIRMWVARKSYTNKKRHVQRAPTSVNVFCLETHVVHMQKVIRGYLCRKQLASKMSWIQASSMIPNPMEKMKVSNSDRKNELSPRANRVQETADVTSISNTKNYCITCNASESDCCLGYSSPNDADEISFTVRYASMKRDIDTVGKIDRFSHETDHVGCIDNKNDDACISTSQNTAHQIFLTNILQNEPSAIKKVVNELYSLSSKDVTAMAKVCLTPAANRIQEMFRGFAARERFMLSKFAAVLIQSAFRGHLRATNYRFLRKFAILIQALYRGRRARREYLSQQERLNSLHRSKSFAATQIQRVWRGYVKNIHFILLILASIKIQSLARRRIAATKLLTIQCAARLFTEETTAAVVIQKIYRAFKAREQFIFTELAAVIIQSAFRGRLGATSYHSLRKSTILTQALYRGKKARQEVSVKRVTRMEAHAPAAKLALQQKNVNADIQQQPLESFAATQIQRVWRCYMANTNFILLILATIKIQSFARKHIAATKYLNLRIRVVYAQASFRGTKARRDGLIKREKAIILQGVVRRFLAKLERARILTAVTTLQRFSRGMITRMQLHVEDFAATEIQRTWRGYRANVYFMLTVMSAIKIQSFVRFVSAKANARLGKEWSAAETRNRMLAGRRITIEDQHIDLATSKSSFECKEMSDSRTSRSPNTEAESFKLNYTATSHHVGPLPPIIPLTASHAAGTESFSDVIGPPDEFGIKQASKFARETAKAIRTIQMNEKFYEVLKAVVVLEKITSQSAENCRVIVNADAHRTLTSILCICNRSPPHIELVRSILSVLTNLSQHPDLLSRLASDRTTATLTDLVHLFRDKSNLLLLSSSLLEKMLRSNNHLVPKFSTPENKNRLRGIIYLCKDRVSELNDVHKCIHCLENVIRMCECQRAHRNISGQLL